MVSSFLYQFCKTASIMLLVYLNPLNCLLFLIEDADESEDDLNP